MYLLAYTCSGAVIVAFTASQRLGAEAQVFGPVLAIGVVTWLALKLRERAYRWLQVLVCLTTLVVVGIEPTSAMVFGASAVVMALIGVHWHRKRRKNGSGKSASRRRR